MDQSQAVVDPTRRVLVHDLRTASAWRLMLVSVGLAWVWMVSSLFGGAPETPAQAMGVFSVLLVLALITKALRSRAPTLVPTVVAAGLVIAVSAAIELTGSPEFAYLYAVPVLVAGALIHLWAGFLLAILINVVLALPLPIGYEGLVPGTAFGECYALLGPMGKYPAGKAVEIVIFEVDVADDVVAQEQITPCVTALFENHCFFKKWYSG